MRFSARPPDLADMEQEHGAGWSPCSCEVSHVYTTRSASALRRRRPELVLSKATVRPVIERTSSSCYGCGTTLCTISGKCY